MNNLTVSNLINTNPADNAFAVRDMSSDKPNNLIYLYKNGKTDRDAYAKYRYMEVFSWHCEPNFEDNGVIDMTQPCRVVITVDSDM